MKRTTVTSHLLMKGIMTSLFDFGVMMYPISNVLGKAIDCELEIIQETLDCNFRRGVSRYV